MSLNVKLKLTKYYLIRLIASITFITLYGCGGGNSEVEVKEEVVIPPAAQAPITDTLDLIGLWMSNCGERNNSAYYANELVLTSENLEIIPTVTLNLIMKQMINLLLLKFLKTPYGK